MPVADAARELLDRSREQGRRAREILARLELIEGWSRFGRPVLVGAVAHDLALDPDIDLEIYCPRLEPEHGFTVLARAARVPGVLETLYQDHRGGPDGALYWRIRYRDGDGTDWKVDMWSAPDDYALARGETLVGPLARALTPEIRLAILGLKQWRAATGTALLSIDLYRAVVDGGVRDPDGLTAWLARNETGVLTDWLPGRG
ncbi:MAG: hypothetical protein AB7U59_00850 [Desulfovibrionaceae bacterium]